MMGRQAVSEQLFYDFRLEDHVPEKHLLRQLDKVLRFDGILAALASYYSHTGRSSIDPELMLRMMLVGYAYGIRSDRRLCEQAHLNLAYRWFCRLGLDGAVPDHSTFSKNRYGRFQASGIYRTLFEEVVSQCQGAGLVSGEGFAVDGTLIAANANYAKQAATVEELRGMVHPASVSRPVRAYLDALDAALPKGTRSRSARRCCRRPTRRRPGARSMGTRASAITRTTSSTRNTRLSSAWRRPRPARRRKWLPRRRCWSGRRSATG
jgi:transposase